MDSPEGMSACLKLLEVKKNSFMKAILKLAVEWKGLDEHLDTTWKYFNEGHVLTDIEMKYNVLQSQQESMAESNKELNLVRESLKLHLEELECREDKFRSFQLARVEELKTREEQMEATQMWVVERVNEFELREEKLNEQKKLMEVLLGRIESKKEEFVGVQKSVGKKLDVIGLRERHCDDRFQELDAIQDFVLGRVKELELREKRVEVREKQVEAIHKTNDQHCKEHEIKLRDLSKIIDSGRNMLNQRAKELESREKLVELREKRIQAVPFNEEYLKELEIKVQDQYRALDTLRDLRDKWGKELDLGGKQVVINKFFSLQEKVFDYIRKLVEKGQHLDAIRYVCTFDLGDEFPPATLLKGYISHVEEAVEEIRKEGNFSLRAQDIAIKEELKALKAMINCIRLHTLESEYTLENLEAHIEELERQRTDWECFVSSPLPRTQSQERSDFQKRERHTKKRKGYVLEHANKPQIQALFAEKRHQTTVPHHQHQPLFPIQVPCHLIPSHSSVGSTSGPSVMEDYRAGAWLSGDFPSSGYEPGTTTDFALLYSWSSAWP